MTISEHARALAEAVLEPRHVTMDNPVPKWAAVKELARALLATLDAPPPLDRETLCLTEEEHEEAYAQFRRLDAADDPYALDKLLVHWAHRLRPRLVGPTGTTGPFGRNK